MPWVVPARRNCEYFAAGCAGFGLGTFIYKPGMTTADVADRAQAAVAAYDQGKANEPKAQLFCDSRCEVGEGPFWHPLLDRLFWFDSWQNVQPYYTG